MEGAETSEAICAERFPFKPFAYFPILSKKLLFLFVAKLGLFVSIIGCLKLLVRKNSAVICVTEKRKNIHHTSLRCSSLSSSSHFQRSTPKQRESNMHSVFIAALHYFCFSTQICRVLCSESVVFRYGFIYVQI